MEKVIPVWHLLSALLPLPDTQNGHIDRPQRVSSNIVTLIRLSKTIIMVAILLTFFVHEAVNLIFNRKDWEKYYENANKIITLLTLMRCTVASMKNVLTLIAFLTHMGKMRVFLNMAALLQANLRMSRARQLRHRFVGICMCLPYLILFPICTVFVVIYLDRMAILHPDKTSVPFGIFRLPVKEAYIVTLSADLFGAVVACSIYLLIGMFARILRECCVVLNSRMRKLRRRAGLDDEEFRYSTFQDEIRDLRSLYEQIVDAYFQYERAFSCQIILGVAGNTLLMFASVASFFKSNLSKEWILAHTTALACTFYSVTTLCFHPIQLQEESRKITENLQTLIHCRQERYFFKTPENPEHRKKTKLEDESPMEEYLSLFSFLQRSVTTPLIVSAGGFVEITRAFIISLIAMLIGFVFFLLEQYEGHKPLPHSCIPAFNRTKSWYNSSAVENPPPIAM